MAFFVRIGVIKNEGKERPTGVARLPRCTRI
jgi:hypothetical protein